MPAVQYRRSRVEQQTAHLGVHAIEQRRQVSQRLIGQRLDPSQRMIQRNARFQIGKAGMLV